MFSVMVVDDESSARNGLVGSVNWHSFGCEFPSQVQDGIEALELLKSTPTDIVITDIKMPGMDGIELAKHIYEDYPSIKVIILTGYSDFSYAQSAIRYNVVDFILKPIIVEKISEAISKAAKQIVESNEEKVKLRSLENKYILTLEEIREKYFQEIINGLEIDKDAAIKKTVVLNLSLSNYYILSIEINSREDHTTPEFMEARYKSIPALKNLISLTFRDITHYNVFVNNRMLCTIVSFDHGDTSVCLETIFTMCEKILELVDSFSNMRLSIGISHMHHTPSEIRAAYCEAEKALTQNFYNDNNSSIFVPFTQAEAATNEINTGKAIDLILRNVESGNLSAAVIAVNNLLESYKALKLPVETIKNMVIQLCSLCLKLLFNHNIKLSTIENGDTIYKDILQSDSFQHLSLTILKVVKTVASCLNSPEMQSNNIVKKAADYIKSNFSKNLTLPILSDYSHVSSSYLSRIFRKETGLTVVEYITKIRMEKAKELLGTSNLQISDIANLVGIDDPAYFSQIFKKYAGMSPKEYKYIVNSPSV